MLTPGTARVPRAASCERCARRRPHRGNPGVRSLRSHSACVARFPGIDHRARPPHRRIRAAQPTLPPRSRRTRQAAPVPITVPALRTAEFKRPSRPSRPDRAVHGRQPGYRSPCPPSKPPTGCQRL